MNSLDHCKSLLTGPLTSSFTPYSLFMTGQPQEILLKCKILSPLCSKPLWFPISLGAKVKDLTLTLKTLHHLPCTFTSDMSPVTPSCWLPHSARAATVSCFFPKSTRNSATPGPLPLLVPLPGTLFSLVIHSFFDLRFLFERHPPRKAFSDRPI